MLNCGIRNVALNRRIHQSSWYAKTRSWGNYKCCAADYANDGNATTFSHTNYEYSPYLWVDLGRVYDIKRIEIINRSDQAGEFSSVILFSYLQEGNHEVRN